MKLLIGANWKMYKLKAQARTYFSDFLQRVPTLPNDREVAFFVPYTLLDTCSQCLQKSPYALGGQNVYPEPEGAYTGEVSPLMLKDAGCSCVLIGHSERRQLFNEDNAFIQKKLFASLQESLQVVLCVGETLAEREANKLSVVLRQQLDGALSSSDTLSFLEHISVAYEPIWAIGTGKVASSQEIEDAHGTVREILVSLFGEKANENRILYGGSVKANNAPEIIKLDNVNGLLVGGASLQAETFEQIVLA